MKFSPGDRVSFVNEKQKGIVTGYRGNLVLVEIEEGFELPVRESELVKIISSPPEIKKDREPEPKEFLQEWKAKDLISLCEAGAVTVAAIPEATGAVLSGKINYFIVNRSGHTLLFTFYAHEENNWEGLCSGNLSNDDLLQLTQFDRTEIFNVRSFLVQGIFHVEESIHSPEFIRKEISVMIPSLSTTDKNVPGLLSFAMKSVVYAPLRVPEEDPYNKDLEAGIQDLKEHFGKQQKQGSPKHQELRPGTLLNEKEVDLHIEELTDSFAGMSNSDMLKIQLRCFSSEMDAAIKNHFRRIIFIHGVGNGRLKQEIRRELRNYSGVSFRDADPGKYGRGATEVILI